MKKILNQKQLERYDRSLEKRADRIIAREVTIDVETKEINKKRAVYHKETRKLASERMAYEAFQEMNCRDKDYKPQLLSPSNKIEVKAGNRIDIIISDLHYSGKRDDNGIKKLFVAQINQLKLLNTLKMVKKVRLAFLGDDIEGELHLSSLDKHQEENTVNQVNGVKKHYADFINSVCDIVGFNNVEIAFVPESNHGQIRLHGLSRGQAPRNDVGYIIREFLIDKFMEKGVKFWDSNKGIVETDDTFYLHGDKPFAKNANSVRLTLGKHKNIVMGHWHQTKVSQHKHTYLIVAPKATQNRESYSDEAGYDENPAQIMWIKHKKNGDISIECLGI